jgi:hypothetical protein
MKVKADEATELIAGVLKQLSESQFQGNTDVDFFWRARVIVSSLDKLGIELEYEDESNS